MEREDLLHRLVGLIYDAALGRDGAWTDFLAELRDAVHGCQAAIFIQGLNGTASRMLSLGDPDRDRAYAEHYGSVNPWFTEGQHLIRPGAVTTSEWFAPEKLRRTEFYADWLRPQEMFYAINGFIFDGPGIAGNVAVAKSWSRGGPAATDVRLFEILIPHLQRAIELQRRLGVPAPGTPLASAMEHVPHGVLVIDARGRVTCANRTARRLLDERAGLELGARGELKACRPADARQLRQLLSPVTWAAGDKATDAGALTLSADPDGARKSVLTVYPIDGKLLAFQDQPAAVVIVRSGEGRARPKERDLQRIYGLTQREATVAAYLAGGMRLREVAATIGVGYEGVRTHLSHVMQKTGTHGQPELVRLLLLGCPLVGDEPSEKTADRRAGPRAEEERLED